MTIEKKKLYGFDEVTTSGLTDKLPTLQGGTNKVTTLQKVYNLFKTLFDSVYTTTSAVATQISNALTNYATQTFASNVATEAYNDSILYTNQAVETRQEKQSIKEVPIDASSRTNEINVGNCVLSITNIPGGTGNKTITVKIVDGALSVGDVISTSLMYRGFDVNLRSWILRDVGGEVILEFFINVHSSPTEPVLIAINKIN